MKTPARKPISPLQHFEKTPTADSAGLQASLTRLQFCFFLSGAAGLIDQVVWTKALGLLFGYSAYAVATVLAVFMGGLALGSALFARWRPAKLRGVALYAWLEFAIAGSALLSLPGIALVRHVYLATYPHAGGSFLLLDDIALPRRRCGADGADDPNGRYPTRVARRHRTRGQ